MALNIEDPDVEALVAEIAALTGESETEVIGRAVMERRERLGLQLPRRDRAVELLRFLECEVWPFVPPELLGRGISKAEQEAILGYNGSDGN
jgi:antitoxin VapB